MPIFRLNTESQESKIQLYDNLKTLSPGHYVVKIEKVRPQRTLNQNSYYWFVLNFISIETGQDSESLHDEFKRMFNVKVEFLDTGMRKTKVGSTTVLDTYEFTLYLDKIINFALEELNINIPSPDDLKKDEYERVSKEYAKHF